MVVTVVTVATVAMPTETESVETAVTTAALAALAMAVPAGYLAPRQACEPQAGAPRCRHREPSKPTLQPHFAFNLSQARQQYGTRAIVISTFVVTTDFPASNLNLLGDSQMGMRNWATSYLRQTPCARPPALGELSLSHRHPLPLSPRTAP